MRTVGAWPCSSARSSASARSSLSVCSGLTMAFGAGVLISAVAFDLVEEAFTHLRPRAAPSGFGLLAGALVFFLGDAAIDRMGGANRKRSSGDRRATRRSASCSAPCSTASRSRSSSARRS